MSNSPLVAIVSGSLSDDEMVDACAAVLDQYGIVHERRVLSAHRQAEAHDVPENASLYERRHLSR